MDSNNPNGKPRPEDLVDLAEDEQTKSRRIEISSPEEASADSQAESGEPMPERAPLVPLEESRNETPSEDSSTESLSASNDSLKVEVPTEHNGYSDNLPVSNASSDQVEKKFGLKKLLTTKKIIIPTALGLIIAAIVAVPVTRYATLGIVMKKDVVISANDSENKNPVSEAVVTLNGKEVKTDASGKAEFKAIPVGEYDVKISKKNYADSTSKITVPVLGGQNSGGDYSLAIKATGRQLAVAVTNKISGKPLTGALVKVGESEAKSGEDGVANLVITPGQAKQKMSVSNNGFNSYDAEVEIKQSGDTEAKAELAPGGKVYFLSKKSGKIDVVKTNLDGSERQTVLAGTGKEDDRQTVMLASRDWKYLALLSRREGSNAKLYLIETASDKVTPMDEGNADFTLTGWADDSFIYTVARRNLLPWQDKREALKAYNASTKTIKTLAESTASGSSYADQKSESISRVIAVGKEVVFTKYGINAESSFNTVKTDGTGLKKIKASAVNSSLDMLLYEPKEVYISINSNEGPDKDEFYEYKIGGSNLEKITKEDYEKSAVYPTFLLSPSGTKNFWSQERDGRPVLFIGDDNGGNEKQYQSGDQKYKQYGWFSDDYLLVSLNDSELYIAGAGNNEDKKFLKISDYHKPAQTFPGYGGGYGGF